MRKSKIGFLLVIFICLGFTKALANPPSGTLTNEVNTLTINGNFWCGYTQTGMPPPSGNYILTMDWTDLGGNPVNYQTPLASPDPLVTGSSVNISCLNNASFPTDANDSYDFSAVNDLTITITSATNPSLSWTLQFNLGNWVMPANGTPGFNSSACVALPVSLISFTAQKVAASTVNLTWQTDSEYDMLRYDIERSNDGITFIIIGSVTSVNSPSLHNYYFTDNYPAAATQFYRLRMVKIYGSFTNSYIRTVQGLTPQPQPTYPPAPPAVPCNLTLTQLYDSSCTRAVTKITLGNMPSNIPSWSSVSWSSTPFYSASAPDYKFVTNTPNAYVHLTNANVVTVSATVSGCSTGGTVARTIFKGTPAIRTATTYQNTSDPCTGLITSSSARVTITPFPGTSGSQYEWYINNNYNNTGLFRTFNTFNNPSAINYEVRFVGPCGTSLASGYFGSGGPIFPVEQATYKVSPNPATDEFTVETNRPVPIPCDPPPTYKSTVANSNLIDGYEILDYMGNVVKRQMFRSAISTFKVRTAGIKKGNYRLRIYNGKTFTTKQIILVR